MRPRVLLWSPLDDYLADLLGASSAISFGRIRSAAELAEVLADAVGIVMLGHLYTADVAALVRQKGRRLRWIQLTTAGYDGFTFHGVPAPVAVTNAGHSHAPMVAEHAVMLLVALTRRLHLFAEPQTRHVFDRGIALPLATLEDSTVVILGYGGIGRETARRAKAFGARVLAVARSARQDEFADAVVASHALHAVLAEADSLVITAALTEETKGMIGASALAAMKPGGVLVNIARGGIVDTDALVEALMSGQLAGAGLDVTDPEPPPPDHPLWSCPNLIVTPHISGLGSAEADRCVGDGESRAIRCGRGTAAPGDVMRILLAALLLFSAGAQAEGRVDLPTRPGVTQPVYVTAGR
jgi:phosphoglycerate dehydrogenase-like enzyme